MNRRLLLLVPALLIAAGCAPKGIEEGVNFYADQYRVRDAAARRVKNYWYLRCDELILSDLEDASKAGQKDQADEMRRLAGQAIRAAASLARETGLHEIDRLPEQGRRELARTAGVAEADLKSTYAASLDGAASSLLREIDTADVAVVKARVEQIQHAVEALPDDQGRAGRRALLFWAALPAWNGVESIEKRSDQPGAHAFKPFENSIVFVPAATEANNAIARYAPLIRLESPAERSYPADYDRFGEIYLSGDPAHVDVHVNTSRPAAYAYESQAKINGKRYQQLVYVWWFPQRPSMTGNDPAAGRIDGDTLRITLDSSGKPAVFEFVQGCGCGHLVYVTDAVEQQARREFGPPLTGKQLSVERDVQSKRDLIVSGTVQVSSENDRPVIYVQAGYHAVTGLRFESAAVQPAGTYTIHPYDDLKHLPLGGGFASMFGPDGLVHNAGRKEGLLLAPTGMLSAGQPRQRGTQKIRWDEYAFDDPRLLEQALRLPSGL